jgi:uncharacterized membrane protein HdeD (DUF308 family)
MRAGTVLGIILIVLGVIALAYQGFTYTTRKDVADIGPIHATKTEHHHVPLPPIIGIVALAGGIIILAADRKKA